MKTRILRLLILISPLLTHFAVAQDEAKIQNWSAPPYWSPVVAGQDAMAGERPAIALSNESVAPLAVPTGPLPFVGITPCRVADTRDGSFPPGYGPPFMSASAARDFVLWGRCGIPSTAQAVSFNFTVTNTAGSGFLLVYPAGGASPLVSTLNYLSGQTIANAAVTPLGTGGALTAIAGVSGFDLIIDVNGYYAPQNTVNTLNALTGDVTLAAGSNLTLTPAGNTLTLAAPLTSLNASNVTSGVLSPSFGGTGATSAFAARLNLGAAASGANADITSLSGLTTPLSILQGGTGSATPFASVFQARVTGTCAAPSFVTTVNSDGTVTCVEPIVDPRPGFTLSTLDSAGTVGQYTSVTIGTDGLGLISYYDATNFDLKVAHCSNTASSAATISTLDSTGIVGEYTSVTIGADGFGLISYYDFTNGDLKVAHCSNTACSTATTATLDSAGAAGYYSSVTIGADGLGLISYFDITNGDLKVAHCSNAACSTATTFTLDSVGSVGQYTSVSIGADSLGLISYYDVTNGDLKVAHCSNPSCSAAITTTLDSVGDVGRNTSVAIGADGLGIIGYWDVTNGDLKVAHCSNAACSTATTATLDSNGTVGQFTSVTIGADGLGLISYYDQTNTDLKVAHCSNAACSTATTATLDSVGNVGPFTSITIGADGLGLISYSDATNSNLKVAHCGSPFCQPFVRRR